MASSSVPKNRRSAGPGPVNTISNNFSRQTEGDLARARAIRAVLGEDEAFLRIVRQAPGARPNNELHRRVSAACAAEGLELDQLDRFIARLELTLEVDHG